MGTFLRELEMALAQMDDAGRARVLGYLQGLIGGFQGFGRSVTLSGGAIMKLIADLTMYKSMGKSFPEVVAKVRELALKTGPYVDHIFRAL